MAKQSIYLGAAGNDGTGDDLRTAGEKVNQNFDEVYGDISVLQSAAGLGTSGVFFESGGIVFEGTTVDSSEIKLLPVDPTADRTILIPDANGTIALVSDITSIVDSAYISLITGTAFDSASTLVIVRANSIDSADAITLIDSAYIQLRQAVTTGLDSAEILSLIDSSYIKLQADSSYLKSIIDSSYIQSQADSSYLKSIIDTTYIQSQQTDNLDSGEVIALIDSDYVKARATTIDLNNYTVATVPNSPPHGNLVFVNNGNSGAPCIAVYDSDVGYYRRIALGAQIST
jgi:hypothetical protein